MPLRQSWNGVHHSGVGPFSLLIWHGRGKGVSNRDEVITVFILLILDGSVKFLALRDPQKYLSPQNIATCPHFMPDTLQGPRIQKQTNKKKPLTEYPNNIFWL